MLRSKVLLIGTIFLWFSTLADTQAQSALSFPTNTPQNEVQGGYFNRYFTNIFNVNHTDNIANNITKDNVNVAKCPDGMAIIGFYYPKNNPPYLDPLTGKPVCAEVGSDGLAKGFTGSMIGSSSVIPRYNDTGTWLVNSIMSQTSSGGILINGQGSDNNIKLEVKQDDSGTQVSEFSRTVGNQKLAFSTYIYPGNSNYHNNNLNADGRDFLSGTVMLYANRASKHLNVTAAHQDSDIRFVVGDFTSRNNEQLRINKNGVSLLKWEPGNGKILVSQNNEGLTKWKTFAEILQENNFSSAASSLTGGLKGTDNFLPMWSSGGTMFTPSILEQWKHQNTASGIIVHGDLYVGSADKRDETYTREVGRNPMWNRLWFEWTAYNSDPIALYRYNEWTDISALRLLLGDNEVTGQWNTEKFQIGPQRVQWSRSHSADDFVPRFTFLTSGKLGIKTDNPSAELDIRGQFQLQDGSQGSGKVLVSDSNGLARWETANFGGNNPNDCSATEKIVNGHIYPIIALVNGKEYLSLYTENIPNGTRQWVQKFQCNKGNLVTYGGERTDNLFCNNGYTSNGSACIAYIVNATNNCIARIMVVNNRRYEVPAINHNFSATVYSSSEIENGAENFKQIFQCNNGTLSPYQNEERLSITCSAGFAYNGSACVKSNNTDVINAYSGSTCNTSEIQIENLTVTPGNGTVLKANTLYKFAPGEYDINSLTLSECTAIVGSGTGNTTLYYNGTAYGSEDFFKANVSKTVIKDITIDGQSRKNSQAKARNIVRYDDYTDGQSMESVSLKNATNAAITSPRINKSRFNNLEISNSEKWIDTPLYDGKITNVTFKDISDQGLAINRSGNIEIKNLEFINPKNGGYVQWENVNISGLKFFSNSGSLITQSGLGLDNLRNSHISNIEFYNLKMSHLHTPMILRCYGCSNSSMNHIKIHDISFPQDVDCSEWQMIKINGGNTNIIKNILLKNILSGRGRYCPGEFYHIHSSMKNWVFENIDLININNRSQRTAYIKIENNNNSISNVRLSNITNTIFDIAWENNTLNNIITENTTNPINISNHNNTLRNLVITNNSGPGLAIDGNNTALSNVYIYNNSGAALQVNGRANYYFDKLYLFNNNNNNLNGLQRGTANMWLNSEGFKDGTLITNQTFSPDWLIRPTNVTGWNANARGFQENLTFPQDVKWSFGSKIPYQVSPVIPSACNISTTSSSTCRPQFGGPDTYNASKRVGDF